jgi:hypothetical protein
VRQGRSAPGFTCRPPADAPPSLGWQHADRNNDHPPCRDLHPGLDDRHPRLGLDKPGGHAGGLRADQRLRLPRVRAALSLLRSLLSVVLTLSPHTAAVEPQQVRRRLHGPRCSRHLHRWRHVRYRCQASCRTTAHLGCFAVSGDADAPLRQLPDIALPLTLPLT